MSTTEAPEGYFVASDGTLKCQPGAPLLPVNCKWHAEHHWCEYCLGYYGVPHDESMHKGSGQHPLGNRDVRSCVCRFCREEVARLDMQQEVLELREKALDHEAMKAAAVAVYWDFEFLLEARNLLGVTGGIERLSNSMSDLSSWVHGEIEKMREEDLLNG